MRGYNLSFAVILTGLCLTMAAAQQRRAIRPEDAYLLASVSDPQISVDGKSVVYVLSVVDRDANKRVSSIWVAPVDGTAKPRQFIAKAPARFPRWSPDGKWLAYITSGAREPESAATTGPAATAKKSDAAKAPGPKSQIWLVPRAGTAPHQITSFENGVTSFDWSPDSSAIVAVAATRPGGKETSSSDVRHYTSMIYKRNGPGWFDQNHSHLWVVQLGAGEPRQLTSGGSSDESDPHWSPDGKWIAYVHEDFSDDLRQTLDVNDIEVVGANGGPSREISDHQSIAGGLAWSPDSRSIAYTAATASVEDPLLWIADASGNHHISLADDADLFPTEVHWTPDNVLWFGATDHGTAHIFNISPGTKHAITVVGGERAVHEPSFSIETGELVFIANDALHPMEVFASDLQDKHEHQLTAHNSALLSQLNLQKVERFNYKGADGLPIQGFFMKPRGWQPDGHYPLILAIHGGPAGMFGEMWEMDLQLYAAQGWAVLFCNPRGSSGYGMSFQRAVAGQWGGQPYEDLMKGVDAVLAKYTWIDRNRLGVVGWSYGGFMTDWIITQTHRFKAAISIAGISDLISVEGTRDFAYGHSNDFGGDVFAHPELYRKYSAVLRASVVTTPTLFLQGEADQRVPASQSEEFFRALKHFGVPSELVLFPRENHMLPVAAEPRHLVESYQWRLDWFSHYLGADR